jgi:hypothetical protein
MPLTNDPILAQGHFCNVRREDDRGTRWVAANIVEPCRDDPDLFLKVAVARFVNEPTALAEIDWQAPLDLTSMLKVLEARQTRGETVFHTQAYKYPMPPEIKGMGALRCLFEVVLGPMHRDRERLCPRVDDTLQAFSDRLRECHGVGPFLAAQIIADLKHVEPLRSASDWWTFAVPGPGSARGLNRVCGRPLNATWSEPQWHATLLQFGEAIRTPLADAGIPPLDAQNLQNVLCEFDKYERAREKGGKPSRKYQSATATTPRAKRAKPRRQQAGEIEPVSAPAQTTNASPELLASIAADQADESAPASNHTQPPNHMAASEAPDTARMTMTLSPPLAPTSEEIPDYILTGIAATEPPRLAAALAYAGRGWRVFPAPLGTKRSYKSKKHSGGVNWGATNNPDEIRRDFAQWPQATIGIPTGQANGIWVLEADTPKGHGVDGLASLQALITEHRALPATLQAESPSGSAHYYFKWPADKVIRNSASTVAPGVDVRGEGGMVIAPPSVHGNAAYRWVVEVEIAAAPEWLITLATAANNSGDSSNGDAREANLEPEAELSLIEATVDAIPNPDLDWEQWNKVGMAIYAASGGSAGGFAIFDKFSQKSDKYDAEYTADKWRKYHSSPPTQIGFGSLQYWADEAAAGGGEQPASGNGGAQTGEQPSGGAQTGNGAQPSSGASGELDEWDAGELLSGTAPQPRQWLQAGQFCRTFLSGLVAPGDVGKTTLRLTQAVELATGRELLGLRVYQRCRVLVISFEDDRDELHRRLLAICRHHGIDPAELKGWLFCKDLNGGPKLAELDARGRRRQIGLLDAMLRQAIKRRCCDLLILDPFVKLHALNESDNPDMDFVCSLLIKIAQDYNIAVDSPAHTHKGRLRPGMRTPAAAPRRSAMPGGSTTRSQ